MTGRRLFAFVGLSTLMAGCVQFQPRQLYSGVEPAPAPERPRTINLAVEPVIYDDADDDTVWFQDDARCTQGELTSEMVYRGERAVRVSWDRSVEGCEWAGFGFGWDGWAGKDLSQVLPYAAVEMYVRAEEGRLYGLPVVLTLEDYSGGMGFAYTNNQYFERPFIDEEWQRVVVPLNDFDLEAERLDATNVKQLMFELQGSGTVYIDAVNLVWYEPEPEEPWIDLPERPDPTALPITLFSDSFINDDGWGLVNDACQSVALVDDGAAEGSVAIQMEWDATVSGCYQGSAGVSWAKWYPVNATPIAGDAAIQLQVRVLEGNIEASTARIGLQDYTNRVSSVPISARFSDATTLSTEWATLTIPFAALEGDADFATVKQLLFQLEGAGEILVDDIRLIRLGT